MTDTGKAGGEGDTVSVWVKEGLEDPGQVYVYENEVVLSASSADGDVEVFPPGENAAPLAAFSFDSDQIAKGESVTFDASRSWDLDGAQESLSFVWDFGDGSPSQGGAGESDNGMVVDHVYGSFGARTPTLRVTDAAGELTLCTASATQVVVDPGPSIAPPIDPNAPALVADMTEFLYEGDDPIQVDVPEGTIEAERAGVVRGVVRDRDGNLLEGVKVSVQHHDEGDSPEDENFGSTSTRGDGEWDLAVNASGSLTINYEHADYFPVQRQAQSRAGDWVVVDDIVMVERPGEAKRTTVDPASDEWQVVDAPTFTDDAGSRHETLVFPPDNTATMHFSDGSSEEMTVGEYPEWSVTAVEYTVGPGGPETMPAELPPTSGYTYAAEYSIGEADDADAVTVEFSKPVITYLENFLALPVGILVPMAHYDTTEAAWVPEADGVVLQVLADGDGDGLPDLDLDGDGTADDPSAEPWDRLGITDSELEIVAEEFETGQELWRNPLETFSRRGKFVSDKNLPIWWPDVLAPWDEGGAEISREQEEQSCLKKIMGGGASVGLSRAGAVVDCENRSVGESVGLAATGGTLNYGAKRAPGNELTRQLDMTLVGDEVAEEMESISVDTVVGGRVFSGVFEPEANLRKTFTWDGLDAYGRRIINGETQYRSTIGYTYPISYRGTAAEDALTGDPDVLRSFALIWRGTGRQVLGATEIELEMDFTGTIGTWDARAAGLGGWTLSGHHSLDPVGGVLHLGSGEDRVLRFNDRRREPFAGCDSRGLVDPAVCGPPGPDGRPASTAQLAGADDIEVAPDGTVYIIGGPHSSSSGLLYAIDPDTEILTLVPEPVPYVPLSAASRLAVEDDGALLVTYPVRGGPDQWAGNRVYRMNPDGSVDVVAGVGGWPGPDCGRTDPCGDGGPALDAQFQDIGDVAVSPDGTIFIADEGRVRAVTPEGEITTVAGTGLWTGSGDPDCEEWWEACGDGGPATDAIVWPGAIAVGPDGLLYISSNYRVRRVEADGTIVSVVGRPDNPGGPYGEYKCQPQYLQEDLSICGDGGPARDARLTGARDLYFADDGSLYIADEVTVRRVRDGIIERVAGNAMSCSQDPCPAGPALGTPVHDAITAAVTPDGRLLVGDDYWKMVGQFSTQVSPYPTGAITVASESGDTVYMFNAKGRHLSTHDALSGAPLEVFDYQTFDGQELLTTVTDPFGNTTTIERDPDGTPTAIEGPFGRRNTFSTRDSDGYLETVSDPQAPEQTAVFGYNGEDTGLLAGVTDPGLTETTFGYADRGIIDRNEHPAGASLDYTQVPVDYGREVTLTSAQGRTQTYGLAHYPDGTSVRTSTDAAGLTTTKTITDDGSVASRSPDGSTTSARSTPDPRFGMHAPYSDLTAVSLPGGTGFHAEVVRSVELDDPEEPFTLQSQRDDVTLTTPGSTRTSSSVVSLEPDEATWRAASTSPQGRVTTSFIDGLGRLISTKPHHTAPLVMGYENRGRIEYVEQASRRTSYTYYPDGPDGEAGQIKTVTDPANRVVTYYYDAAGRIERTVLPGGREVAYGYDDNGNMTSITPPGQPAHTYRYTTANQLREYETPLNKKTIYDYSLDGQLELVTRPDNTQLDPVYDDTTGWLDKTIYPGGQLDVTYDTQDPIDGLEASGRVVRLDDNGQNSHFAYGYTPDGLPESTTLSGPVAGQVSVTYNGDLEIKDLSVNGVQIADYEYDNDGLPTRIGQLGLTRNPDSGRIEETQLGAYTAVPTYDPDYGQLTHLDLETEDGDPIAEYDFVRDDLGRIDIRTETINGQATVTDYDYDPDTGALTDITIDGNELPDRSYDYDDHGNRAAFTDRLDPANSIPEEEIIVNEDDQLKQYGPRTYSYTQNGELNTITLDGAVTRDFGYDGLGRLATVTLDPGTENETVVEYTYDPSGNRIATKTDGQPAQRFLYSGGTNPIAQLDGNGDIAATYIYAGSHVPTYMNKKNGETYDTYMFITDQVGTVRALINTNDPTDIPIQLDYDEYGNLTDYTGDLDFQPFGYAGGLRDDTTNLTHYGARDYDPHTGRFTTPDPAGQAAGTNLYTYVGNNPANLADPAGNVAIVIPAIIAGIAAVWAYAEAGFTALDFYDAGKAFLDWCAGRAGLGAVGAAAGFAIVGIIGPGGRYEELLALARGKIGAFREALGRLSIVGTKHNELLPSHWAISPTKVQEHAKALLEGRAVPPIATIEVGGGKHIVDGHHRYVASQLTGIPVEQADYRLLPNGPAKLDEMGGDISRLQDPAWQDWSGLELAEPNDLGLAIGPDGKLYQMPSAVRVVKP